MSEVCVTRDDLDPVLRAHRGNAALRTALETVSAEPERLLSVLARYTQFNSAFGPGLANLAGEIAARQGLFRDRDEPVTLLSDRAAEVAADFFHAAIDEFDDRMTPWRDTHRTLAQATLKGLGRALGYAPAQLNTVLRINAGTTGAMARVASGYGLAAELDERRLFSGMGFHTGSEVLADEEFTIIDQVLRARRPDLVKALENTKVEILGSEHNAYYWIRIHTSVEADHFDAALKGVNKALRFYVGDHDKAAVKAFILGGFGDFAEVQEAFMAALPE
jgi:hypothetical protein